MTASVPSVPPLQQLGTRTPLPAYLRDVWRRRHFAFALAENEARSEHLDSVLGQFWHLLNPAMMIGVYFLVFGVWLDARRGVEHYVTFLVVGVIVFRFMQNTIMGCARSIPQNLGLIRSIQFPRVLVPLSVLLQNLLSLAPALALVLVVAVLDGALASWQLLALPAVLLATSVFCLGVGLFVARASASVTDLQQVLPHFFRVMLYMSGVIFSVQDTVDNQLVKDLFVLNPFYCMVAAARWSVLDAPAGERVELGMVLWPIVALVLGARYFLREEHRLGA